MSKNDPKSKTDPRVIRTRALLHKAIIELITERGYDPITIQDITDRATLNRATFYLHYRDKNDLLFNVFDELIEEILPAPSGVFDPEHPESVTPDTERIFDHIAEYAGFYHALLGESGAPFVVARFREYIEGLGMSWLQFLQREQPDKENVSAPFEIAANFIGSAYLGVIIWWLDNGMPYSSKYMADQLKRLTAQGVQRPLGLPSTEFTIDESNRSGS
jgi:AcrR family transcriptional regulator